MNVQIELPEGKSTGCGYTRALGEAEIQALLAPGREAGMVLKAPPEKPQDVTLYPAGGVHGRAASGAVHMVRLPKGRRAFHENVRCTGMGESASLAGERLGQAV